MEVIGNFMVNKGEWDDVGCLKFRLGDYIWLFGVDVVG